MASHSGCEEKVCGESYNKLFNPKAYLKEFYSTIGGDRRGEHALFRFQALYDYFGKGEICGESLLDFGSGPTIYTSISAARYFKRVYLSDFAEGNREYLADALFGSKDHGWTAVMKYFLDKESDTDVDQRAISEFEETFRKKVHGILYCDALQDNPLSPSYFPTFDTVVSSLSLEAACENFETYAKIAKNIATLVKANGSMVLIGAIGKDFYPVDHVRFAVVMLNKEQVVAAWEGAGFEINDWRQYTVEEASGDKACAAFFALKATKKM